MDDDRHELLRRRPASLNTEHTDRDICGAAGVRYHFASKPILVERDGLRERIAYGPKTETAGRSNAKAPG